MVSSMPRIDVFFARRAIRLSLKAQITVLLLVAKDTLKLSSTTRLCVANAIQPVRLVQVPAATVPHAQMRLHFWWIRHASLHALKAIFRKKASAYHVRAHA